MKLKYLAFDKVVEDFKGIAIWIDGKEIASGDFSEILDKLSSLPEHNCIQEYKIVSTRSYFDTFVVELSSLQILAFLLNAWYTLGDCK